MHSNNDLQLLKQRLFSLWQNDRSYFYAARQANLVLTGELAEMLRYIGEGDLVLDVACGTSEVGREIAKFAQYLGTDVALQALHMAQDYAGPTLGVICSDVEVLPFSDNTFDVVLSTYALEHFTAPHAVIYEMYRVCKPQGKVILISPAWDCPLSCPHSLASKKYNPFWRLWFTGKQLRRQIALWRGRQLSPQMVKNPDALTHPYRMDNDVVYIASIREIRRYMESLGLGIVHVQKGKRFFNKTKFTEYWLVRLLIVAEKRDPVYRRKAVL